MPYIVAGNDAGPIAPPAITDVPGTMPKIVGRAGDANNGGLFGGITTILANLGGGHRLE